MLNLAFRKGDNSSHSASSSGSLELEVEKISSYLKNIIIYDPVMATPQAPKLTTDEELGRLLETVNALASEVQPLSAARPAPLPSICATSLARDARDVVQSIPNTPMAGAPSSLHSTFPEIEATYITAIITHTFHQRDLHKLDSKFLRKTPKRVYTFNASTIQFEATNCAAREYKTVDSLLTPLVIYLDILTAHLFEASPHANVSHFFFKFITHFHKLTTEYNWPAVLEYTMEFIARRRADMVRHSDYTKWGLPDEELQHQHLYEHRRSKPKKRNTLKAS